MKRSLIFFGCLLCFLSGFSQINFLKKYYNSSNDLIYSSCRTNDGGYILCSNTNAQNKSGNLLIKINESGDTLWTKKYFFDSISIYGGCIIQTDDNGYLITGSQSAEFGVYSIKTDSIGNILWTKIINLNVIGTYVTNVVQTADHGFVIMINSYFNVDFMYILKIDSTGNFLWIKFPYSSILYSEIAGSQMIKTNDGGIIIVGDTHGHNGSWGISMILKIDSLGNGQWVKKYYGGFGPLYLDYINQTNDGGFMAIGGIGVWNSSISKIIIMRLDPQGDTIWTKYFTGDYKSTALSLNDGGYIFGVDDYNNYGLVKIDSLGTYEWGHNYPFNSSLQTYPQLSLLNIHKSSDNGYLLTGSIYDTLSTSNYIFHIDSLGKSLCYDSLFTLNQTIDTTLNIHSDALGTGDALITPYDVIDSISVSIGLILETLCNSIGISEINNLQKNLVIFPNPTGDYFKISLPSELLNEELTLGIFNSIGENILLQRIKSSEEILEPNFRFQASGLYTITLSSKQKFFFGKAVVY